MALNKQTLRADAQPTDPAGFCAFDLQQALQNETYTKQWADNAHYIDSTTGATVLRGLQPYIVLPSEGFVAPPTSSTGSSASGGTVASVIIVLRFLDDFATSNNTAYATNFVNNLADVLGIPASRIIVVSLTPGSVIVKFKILSSSTGPSPTTLATTIETQLNNPNSALNNKFSSIDQSYTPQVSVEYAKSGGAVAGHAPLSLLAMVAVVFMSWLFAH